MISHVILDFDMTLVNSLQAITLGSNRLARHFGLKEVTEAEVRAVMHLDCQAMWRGLWGAYNPAWHDFFITTMAGEEKIHLTALPGAADLLRRLKKMGLGLGLATNRDRPWEALASVGLAPYFDSAAGALEVARAKPAPDMLWLVMERLGAAPDQTIFVGDAPSDMAAAARAGVRGVGLLEGGGDAGELLAAGAWRILAALPELADLWA
ncbi:MAG: HAD family hydrolase [Candidatus Adiutrix sp.]|jgi:HAD superfamily hydrolase (TIGR01509 family)|nr:HAD family hydrolase [Candidatus Adiutrix sp.]